MALFPVTVLFNLLNCSVMLCDHSYSVSNEQLLEQKNLYVYCFNFSVLCVCVCVCVRAKHCMD